MKHKKRMQQTAPQKGLAKQLFTDGQQKWLAVVILFITLAIYFKPFFIDGLSPTGSDVIGSIGKMHQLNEDDVKTKEKSLWNPYLFSGMPVYHRHVSHQLSIDTAIQLLSDTKGRNVFIFYLIGAFGMFFLTRFLGIPIWGSLIASLAFVFIPNYQVLVQVGHFQQFRPIMIMPWVIWGFLAVLKKVDFWSVVLFLISLALQIRTKHYQIVFYTFLILFLLGVVHWIVALRAKQLKSVLVQILILTGCFVVVVGMSLQALWPVYEYTPYTMRGGSGQAGSKGLDYDYATGWSFAPKEMISILIPNAYGGASAVQYKGTDVPELKGQIIPGYWGEMPFTEGGDYVGVLTFFLAVIGIIIGFRKKDLTVIALSAFSFLAFLLAFGRHMPIIYKLFFNYLPFFNKFRVPSMILGAIYFCMTLLAGFGLKYIFQVAAEKRKQIFLYIVGTTVFLVFVGLVPFLFKSLFPFTRAEDLHYYSPQIVDILRRARFDLFKQDAVRLLLFVFVCFMIFWIYFRGWVSKTILFMALGVVMLADLIPINNRFFKNLGSTEDIEQSQFAKTATDQFLLNDKELFRIFPLEQNVFQNNDWSYYHQNIGGYSPEKLRIYQDIIENCIYSWKDQNLPINWNVINMLNGKYIISSQQLTNSHLELVNADKSSKQYIYRNITALPRAFFVGQTEIIKDRDARLARLNDALFDPAVTAILEKELPSAVARPGVSNIEIVKWLANRIEINASTDKNTLLVLSEIYYPKGWKATIDGQATEIYKTDHVLRSVLIPEGQHVIQFTFAPNSYRESSIISGIMNAIVYLGLIGFGLMKLRTRFLTRAHA
jgi:hypothetical protein